MSKTHEELVAAVAEQYRAMAHGLKAQVGPVLKNIDLTIAQLRTLAILAEDGPLVIGQIAQKLGIGLSTGGHLVDRLVHAGLAERTEDTEDRRRTVVRLSPAGDDLYGRLRLGPQHLVSLFSELHDDDLAALLQGISALNRLIGQKSRTVPVN